MTHKQLEEIPELCIKTFLTMDKAIVAVWLAAGLMLTGCGAVVAYGFATSAAIVTLKEKEANNESRINALDEQVNKKLDILIARKESK
jgi:hypothetical protein